MCESTANSSSERPPSCWRPRAGFGLAYFTEEQVREDLKRGSLVRVLADWCPPFSGYHLYYPSRRQPTHAFTLLVNALRYRGQTRAVRKS
jgi:DNA-binding transcriptional LysR family regulator